ncbi:uncharacterized protein [Arachis hypogaea]|uniref:uncharacterized protein n=1 Tax=Arachis hypogaea TaxID=3818 RepID=UPI001105710A|nr:uncharacterized protein LOC114925398 [Arachis hypogaea]
MWQTIDPPKLTMFRAYKTCKKVWDRAKALYTNDIARLYHVAKKLYSLQLQGTDMESYVGAVEAVKEEFSTLLPYVSNANDHHAQQEKLFLVLTLFGLPAELESLRQQILGTSFVLSLEDVFARLLQSGPSLETHTSDQTALASQSSSQVSFQVPTRGGRGGRGNGRGNRTRLSCTYCHRIGHTQDKCYALHGRPIKVANVVQINEPSDVHSAAQPQGIFVSSTKLQSRHPLLLLRWPTLVILLLVSLIPLLLDHGSLTQVLLITFRDRGMGQTIGIGCESRRTVSAYLTHYYCVFCCCCWVSGRGPLSPGTSQPLEVTSYGPEFISSCYLRVSNLSFRCHFS